MKKCKRYLFFMLGILLICALAPLSVHAVETAGNGSSITDWEYTDKGDGSIVLTKYIGTSKDIVIPGKLDGKQVKIKSFPSLRISKGNSLVVGTSKEKVVYDGTSLLRAFDHSTYKSIDLRGLDTSRVTDMDNMFSYCSELKQVDISGIDTSKVTFMASMFQECTSLTDLDLSKLDTSKVVTMDIMFHNCYSLRNLDISNFNTSNLISAWSMFGNCKSLKNLDVSSFNTSNLQNLHSMFSGCSGLTELDLSNFNLPNAKYMNEMFSECRNLKKLDLSNFNISNRNGTITVDLMFSNCNKLQFINLSFEYFPSNGWAVFSDGGHVPTVIITACDGVKSYSADAGKTIGGGHIAYAATVKLNANGGAFAEKAVDTEKTITLGGNLFYNTVDAYKNEFTVTSERIARETANPTKEGATFTGWYLDKECTKPFTTLDMSVGHDSEVTLYAGYGDKKPGTDKPGTNTPAGGNGSNAGNPVQKVIKAVQTGDVSSPYFWAAVAIVAMIGAAVTVLVRRKHLYRS